MTDTGEWLDKYTVDTIRSLKRMLNTYVAWHEEIATTYDWVGKN